MDKSTIKRLAVQCGAYERRAGESLLLGEKMFNKFAQAVIAAYVAEQKPVAWTRECRDETGEGYTDYTTTSAKPCGVNWQPLFTLEGVKP